MSAQNYTEKTILTQDGMKLYYRDYGSELSTRIPVLCLSGLTGNSKSYQSLASHLSSHRRVISLDARGRGQSSFYENAADYSLVNDASDALSVLSSVIGRPSLIIGTSHGGLLSMIINGVRPDLIAGVVMNDIGPEISTEGAQRFLTHVGIEPKQHETIDSAVQLLKAYRKNTFLNLSVQQWAAWADTIYRFSEAGHLQLDYDPKLREAALSASETGVDYWPQYRRMTRTPLLLLWGENSDILSKETVQKMRRSKPDLRLVTVKDRGHAPFLDEPEVIDALDEMLAALDA